MNKEITSTDLLVPWCANSAKLVSENKRKNFEKKNIIREDNEQENNDDNTEEEYTDVIKNVTEFENEKKINQHQNDNKTTQMTKEEEDREKFKMLIKLAELKAKGIKLQKEYSMFDSLNDMTFEYNMHTQMRSKLQTVGVMSMLTLNMVKLIEISTDKYDVWGFNLKGWTDNVNENIDNVNDALGEIYDRYVKSGTSVNPILKLIFALGTSALAVNTSKLIGSSVPNLSKLLKSDPEVRKKLSSFVDNEINKTNTNIKETQYLNEQRKEYEEEIKRHRKAEELKNQLNQADIDPPKFPLNFINNINKNKKKSDSSKKKELKFSSLSSSKSKSIDDNMSSMSHKSKTDAISLATFMTEKKESKKKNKKNIKKKEKKNKKKVDVLNITNDLKTNATSTKEKRNKKKDDTFDITNDLKTIATGAKEKSKKLKLTIGKK